jgi:hypothetical protein
MNVMAKMPALDTIEAEIVRLETRVQALIARRNRVNTWLFADYQNRKGRATIAVARIKSATRATSRGAHSLHQVYMQILHD